MTRHQPLLNYKLLSSYTKAFFINVKMRSHPTPESDLVRPIPYYRPGDHQDYSHNVKMRTHLFSNFYSNAPL